MALAVIEAWCGGFFGFLFVCLSFYIRLLHFGLFFVQKKVLIAKNLELKVAVLSFYCGCTRVSGTGVMLKKTVTKTHLLSAGHILLLAPCFCLLFTCCYLLLCNFLLLFCLLGPVHSCFLLFFSVSLVAFRVSLWMFLYVFVVILYIYLLVLSLVFVEYLFMSDYSFIMIFYVSYTKPNIKSGCMK